MQSALIDEALPRPEGLEAHLASCDDCRALAAAHRGALRLRGATFTQSRRRPLAEVQRRAGIVAGLVLALGGGVGWYQLEFGPPAPALRAKQDAPSQLQLVASPELSMPVVADEPQGELFALAELQGSIALELRRDPREDDAAVRAFGALPRWTAPKRTHPIRSLGRAASPVVFTSEDSP